MRRTTHTYVTIEVPAKIYDFFRDRLQLAGYHQCFLPGGDIDMHGFGLVRATAEEDPLKGLGYFEGRHRLHIGSLLLDLASSQSEWSQRTFGSDLVCGPIGALKHLIKEANEAIAAPKDAEEYADCFLLVIDAARRAGLSLEALLLAAEKKHEENKLRKWETPTTDEPVHHKKEGTDHV